MEKLSNSAQRVQEAIHALGMENAVIEHSQPTRSAREAAQAVGCEPGQIAKSLVFRARGSGQAVLVIASGANRVNEARVGAEIGDVVEKADADFVLVQSGYVIGGVPPLGHSRPLLTLIDEDLLQYEEIWAAGGTPNAVFKVSPEELLRMTSGRVLAVK
jgi:prolyl-tRNA editing enzyme YbaK/EbsC (Cys-tRNA(Pro) deacylase)